MHILKGSVENNVPSYISAEKKSLQKLFVLLKIDTFRKMDTFTKNILKCEAVVSDTGEMGGGMIHGKLQRPTKGFLVTGCFQIYKSNLIILK